jgi:photosystem II stability/assembly factor-like uncharacterized protein
MGILRWLSTPHYLRRTFLRKVPLRSRSYRSTFARGGNFETLEPRTLLVADLQPASFSGWDDSLVVSTRTGTNTNDSPITVNDTVFVDLGWANFGTTAVPANTFLTRLSLDGAPFQDFSTPFSLEPNDGASISDVNLGQLSLGSHTLTLSIDVNSSVGESNELNNIRERTITVVSSTDDHGNDASHSTSVSVPSETAGLIEIGSDRDWFNFVAVGGRSYIFETTLGSLQDSTLRLYNTNGTSQLAFDDDSGVGLGSRIDWTAPASGTFFLEVRPFSTSQTGTYTLKTSALGTEDFGDAPTAAQSGFASSYPTLLANNGARHTPLAGFRIGAAIDAEGEGQPSAASDLDDRTGATDDEDGVIFSGALSIGSAATVEVLVTNSAGVANPYLDAWIDFNRDGDWSDGGEQIFSGAVGSGSNLIHFTVPAGATPGQTHSRFRLHDGLSGLPVTGAFGNGEVEDHSVALALPGVWIFEGPAPTQNGQLEPNTQPNRQVTGAIHTVLAHPTDANTLYIGSVNGGIWKTTNATNVNPDWVPQTDFLSTLSIGAMAFDSADETHNTLVAGTAQYSSFGGLGGVRGPVFRTTDGGANWTELASNGLKNFGENISGIAAHGDTIVVTSSANSGGIFRSIDGGANFTPVSAAGLFSPGNDFTDLVEDPTANSAAIVPTDSASDQENGVPPSDPPRLYAASVGVGGAAGIFRSDDFGNSWTKITGSAQHAGMQQLLSASNNIEMAVHPTTGRLYVAILVSGQPRGIFYTDTGGDVGTTWIQMDVPVLPLSLAGGVPISGASNTSPIQITSTGHGLATGHFVVVNGVAGNTAANGMFRVSVTGSNTFTLEGSAGNGAYTGGGTWTRVTGPSPTAKDIEETGAQGRIHFSITVDPTNEDILYVGGDRQEQPNVIGDNTFGGAIFRGNASIPRNPSVAPSPQWDHLTHDIVPAIDPAGGTANGTAPHADSREMTFDAAGNLIEVDDGGIYRRTSPRNNSGDWFSLAGTLGVIEFHDVAYDSNSNVLIGGTQDNGTHFQMTDGSTVWDFLSGGDGGDVAVDNVTLASTNQSIRYSSFQNLGSFRRSIWNSNNNFVSQSFPALTVTSGSSFVPQFKTPFELNPVDPQRILFIGANGIYESLNQGSTMAQVGGTHSPGFLQDAVAYGGFRDGVPNQAVFYVGVGDDVRIRTTSGGSVSSVDPDSGSSADIRDVVMNPDDWMTAFVIDNNQVFQTTNAGASWSDITGNLMSIAGAALQTIEFVSGPVGAIVVGANLGVFAMSLADPGSWTEVGANLPHALVFDLEYNPLDDILAAGTLGRGAWSLPNASLLLAGVPDPAPTVVDVRIGSSSWSSNFKSFVDPGQSLGYVVPVGAAPLPWANLDQISITFSEPVEQTDGDDLDATNISIVGVNVPDYAVQLSGVFYNDTTHTATISFNQPIGPDKLLVFVDRDDVLDAGGNPLSADLSFRIDVLPGDADRSGAVLGNDVGQVRLKQFSLISGGVPSANYSIFHDIDGSGAILGNDVGTTRLRQFSVLPAGEPVPPAESAALSVRAIDSAFERFDTLPNRSRFVTRPPLRTAWDLAARSRKQDKLLLDISDYKIPPVPDRMERLALGERKSDDSWLADINNSLPRVAELDRVEVLPS